MKRPFGNHHLCAHRPAALQRGLVERLHGSLSSVVESLVRRGWIASRETELEGRRPERTVYELTKTGEAERFDWLRELLAITVNESTQFEAGLSPMVGLNRARSSSNSDAECVKYALRFSMMPRMAQRVPPGLVGCDGLRNIVARCHDAGSA